MIKELNEDIVIIWVYFGLKSKLTFSFTPNWYSQFPNVIIKLGVVVNHTTHVMVNLLEDWIWNTFCYQIFHLQMSCHSKLYEIYDKVNDFIIRFMTFITSSCT